jgi:drug/metabolite transporter (DMT)-like permease
MQSAQFVVVKGRARRIPPLVLLFWSQAMAFTAWAVYFVISGHPLVLPPSIWGWIAVSTAVACAMTYLLARASGRGDISIVGPVLALSPIFAIVPDAVFSGTWPRGLGWLGLALSVMGTMNLSQGATRLAALRHLFAREDALAALGAAVLLGMLSALDRHNALAIGVPSYLVSIYGCMVVVTGLFAIARSPGAVVASLNPRDLTTFAAHALVVAVGTALQTVAITMAPAAYVNAIRRSSAIFAVLLGHTLFHEPGLRGRLRGALLACAGAACLLLS